MVVVVLDMRLVPVGHDSYISVMAARLLPAISSPDNGSKIKMLTLVKVTAACEHRWQRNGGIGS